MWFYHKTWKLCLHFSFGDFGFAPGLAPRGESVNPECASGLEHWVRGDRDHCKGDIPGRDNTAIFSGEALIRSWESWHSGELQQLLCFPCSLNFNTCHLSPLHPALCSACPPCQQLRGMCPLPHARVPPPTPLTPTEAAAAPGALHLDPPAELLVPTRVKCVGLCQRSRFPASNMHCQWLQEGISRLLRCQAARGQKQAAFYCYFFIFPDIASLALTTRGQVPKGPGLGLQQRYFCLLFAFNFRCFGPQRAQAAGQRLQPPLGRAAQASRADHKLDQCG